MKAAVMYKPLELTIDEKVEIPKPKDYEVLVRVNSIGVCPSDVRYYTGEGVHKLVPYGKDSYGLLGHEWSGEVCEVGSNVKNIEVGDKIAQDHLIPCNQCRYCGLGLTNLCINKSHYLRGYAEYALAHASNSYKIPDTVGFEEACFAEPLSCVIHAQRIADIAPMDTVVIIGSGPMGLLHIQLAKLTGARVIASDIIDMRVSYAKKLGADLAINSSEEDLVKVVRYFTEGIGADKVIVTIGNKHAIEQGFQLLRKRGVLIIFGGTIPPKEIQVDPNIIHYNEVVVTGSADHTRDDFRKAMELIASGKLLLRELITHEFPLERLKEAFETVMSRKGLKVIVHP